MSQFVETKTEYKINKNALTAEFEKQTKLNVWISHPYVNDRRVSEYDYSKVELYFDTHLSDSEGNEIDNREFNYNMTASYEDIIKNPNFVFDTVQLVEEKYRQYCIEYCENEIKYLQDLLKKIKER